MELADWDRQTLMPPGGAAVRADALATLADVSHRELTDPSVGTWLSAVQAESLSDDQQANVQAMARQHGRAMALPASLIDARIHATTACEADWAHARQNNDWPALVPGLKRVVACLRDEADRRSQHAGIGRYDSLLDGYEPGMTSDQVDGLFASLKDWLPNLAAQARGKPLATQPLPGDFAISAQRTLVEQAMQVFGFDWERGRLDTSLHPFSGGTPDDSRITTRYDTANVLSGLMSTIHETGHACYEQNLPVAWRDQPLGQACSMAVHESQALLFEMQWGRSGDFAQWLAPHFAACFPDLSAVSADDMHAHLTRIKPGAIRVEADEVHYPAHIMVRYDMERALIAGDIEVEDMPALWSEQMDRYLGLSVAGDSREGCMQDVHWPAGLFGYFPTYAVGAMMAAQLNECLPSADSAVCFAQKLTPKMDYLKSHVWSQGQRLGSLALIKQATGADLSTAALKRHLTRRYIQRSTADN